MIAATLRTMPHLALAAFVSLFFLGPLASFVLPLGTASWIASLVFATVALTAMSLAYHAQASSRDA